MKAVIGILAAGASSRMLGRDKLLEDIDGESLLARQVRIATACAVPVLVAIPPGDDTRGRIVRGTKATSVVVSADPPGMGDSIAALATEAEHASADCLLLHLADMPDITTGDLNRLLLTAEERGTIVRAASEDGRAGHPIVFPRERFAGLRRLTGDIGARAVVAGMTVYPVSLSGERALTDLDTPEAWKAWRAARLQR